ncbi:MAG: ABC transporter substrate-binding protein [Lachnospiraceae bacterium]|nr:ABC transporter substrate-binding protein [Lachnospiraceae bacterium]
MPKKIMKKVFSLTLVMLLIATTLMSCGGNKQATTAPKADDAATTAGQTYSGKVMLYSSMQEGQLQAVKEAFEKKYPGITMDFYFASGGKVITKMTTEAQAGQIDADIIWLGDPSDYEGFKKLGYLQQYSSPEAANIASTYVDKDGYYTAARLVTMGVAWCTLPGVGITDEEAPKTWDDLTDPKWKDQIVMTDPTQASTTKYWMAAMMQSSKYGKDFFQKLRDNGVKLESGTTATHNKVADGSYKVGVCLDYVSASLMKEGSPLNFHYTDNDVVTMTSPVGLVNNNPNGENGKLLYDFILSKEGQEVLVANNLVSVRTDVKMDVDTSKIAAINMPVDFNDLAENTSNYLNDFNAIWGK